MSKTKGRVGIVGAGPAGMAAALAFNNAGYEATLYERYDEVKIAGNILNLWPPPQKILPLLGVDISGLGAACHSVFMSAKGHVRADVKLPQEVIDEYGGGFIGLLRWGLYERMFNALPEGVLRLGTNVTGFTDHGDGVTLHLDGRDDVEADILIGADGINSIVREQLWGKSPIRHQKLHLVGGYIFTDDVDIEGVIAHDRTTQGSYTPIVHDGKTGYEWWVLEKCDPKKEFTEDLLEFARDRAKNFPEPLPSFVEQTPREHMQRWEIRDRKPIKQWSAGRVTIIGDAAHPTSPYAAYGAGMSIEDGYFLAKELENRDVSDLADVREGLQAFEDRRKPHTKEVIELARMNGIIFHRLPAPLRPIRDFFFDHTNFLQKKIGDEMPTHILAQLAEIDAVEEKSPSAPIKRQKEAA